MNSISSLALPKMDGAKMTNLFRDHWPQIAATCTFLACSLMLAALTATAVGEETEAKDAGWKLHTIDASSRGADGVRLADVNGDGRLDIVTGWEEGGEIRVAFQPEPDKTKDPWPTVLVGKVKSPEDALAADLDGDGKLEVISSCEGGTRAMFLHQCSGDVMKESDWTTTKIPVTAGKMWMFAAAADIDGKGHLDLFVSAKGGGAEVGWLELPDDISDVANWKYHSLQPCGWIMTLDALDMDGDGDQDALVSDRNGKLRGVYWLENPRNQMAATTSWKRHNIGGEDLEVMFLDHRPLGDTADKGREIICATRGGVILQLTSEDLKTWKQTKIPNPFGVNNGKAVKLADLNGDGLLDLAHTTNTGGKRTAPGGSWLEQRKDGSWQAHNISGPRGVKFDLIQTLDLDGDGDLDVITCEERDNLGVFWFENPSK